MKKITSILCLLILILSFFVGCNNNDKNIPLDDKVNYAMIKTNSTDKEEIGRLLFEEYLKNTYENYENDDGEIVNILRDYKLNKVNLYEEKENSFLVEIDFETQAIDGYATVFITGNGVEKENNWVTDQYLIIEIENIEDNKYKMTDIYTG